MDTLQINLVELIEPNELRRGIELTLLHSGCQWHPEKFFKYVFFFFFSYSSATGTTTFHAGGLRRLRLFRSSALTLQVLPGPGRRHTACTTVGGPSPRRYSKFLEALRGPPPTRRRPQEAQALQKFSLNTSSSPRPRAAAHCLHHRRRAFTSTIFKVSRSLERAPADAPAGRGPARPGGPSFTTASGTTRLPPAAKCCCLPSPVSE